MLGTLIYQKSASSLEYLILFTDACAGPVAVNPQDLPIKIEQEIEFTHSENISNGINEMQQNSQAEPCKLCNYDSCSRPI